MHKTDFLTELRQRLAGLPPEDREERLLFYSEMIDDRMEDGQSEEDAVAACGTVEGIVAQVAAETPLATLVRERVKKRRRLRAWEIVLLALGSPIWLPLLIAFFAVALSLYIVLWAVDICFWAADLSFAAGAVAGVVGAVWYICLGNPAGGGFLLGCGLVCAGLAIALFFGCKALTKGVLKLTKKMFLGIKSLFLGKETV